MDKEKFDGSILRKLREMNHVTLRDIAAGTGVCVAALTAYEHGRTMPGLNAMISLADFYRVPLDYLVGRSDMIGDPVENFREARKDAYERWLVGGKKTAIPDGYDAPYPYNLLKELFGEHPDMPMSEDQMAGLEDAITSLDDREAKAVVMYYSNDMTLDEVGREFHVTKERARQIIAKGVRKLRYPSRSMPIRYGKQGYALKREEENLNNRICRVNELHDELDMLEQAYEERKQDIREKLDLDPCSTDTIGKSMDIADMNLSVRSYNCLNRAGINTLEALIKAAEAGTLQSVRNLGKKSLIEVLTTVKDLTGQSYFQTYALEERTKPYYRAVI